MENGSIDVLTVREDVTRGVGADVAMPLQGMLDVADGIKSRVMDVTVPERQMRFRLLDGHLIMGGINAWTYQPTRHAMHQACQRFGIPIKYAERMRTERPDLLPANLNGWMGGSDKHVLVRGLRDKDRMVMRALLSDRYRVIDNRDVLYCVMEHLAKHEREGIRVVSGTVNEEHLHLKVRCESLTEYVLSKGDIIQGGFVVSNSDVGKSALRIAPYFHACWCDNGAISRVNAVREIHLGNGGDDDGVYDRLRFAVDNTFAAFPEIAKRVQETGAIEYTGEMATKVVDHVVREFQLTDDQRDNILMAFGRESADRGNTQWAVANAITRAAKDEPTYTGRLNLEAIGGSIAMDDSLKVRVESGRVAKPTDNWLE